MDVVWNLVLMDYIAINMDGVGLILIIILLEKDINRDIENVNNL